MDIKNHVRIIGAKTPRVRHEILNSLIDTAFEAENEQMRVGLLNYNAQLFTALREAKVWPPK